MATKQVFIQIVDKKTGKIEEVVNSRTLEAMDIEKKIALTRGKELYIVTHKVEPVIRIEMKQVKISEPVSYVEPDQSLNLEIDSKLEEEVPQPAKIEPAEKTTKKTTKKPTTKVEEPTEKAEKKSTPRKKKTLKND